MCAEAASAIDWWALAGVDVLVEDAPRDWLKAPISVSEASPSTARPMVKQAGMDTLALPVKLSDLTAWMMDPAQLPWLGPQRVSPSGDAEAGLMIVTDWPDVDDLQSEILLSGPLQRLFDGMLAAIGRDRSSIYLASIAPGRPATTRAEMEHGQMLAKIALRHIALAKPKAVLLMGDATSRVLAGTNLQMARGKLLPLNPMEDTVNAVATFHPRFLLDQPARKSNAWDDLQRVLALLP